MYGRTVSAQLGKEVTKYLPVTHFPSYQFCVLVLTILEVHKFAFLSEKAWQALDLTG